MEIKLRHNITVHYEHKDALRSIKITYKDIPVTGLFVSGTIIAFAKHKLHLYYITELTEAEVFSILSKLSHDMEKGEEELVNKLLFTATHCKQYILQGEEEQ